jgi:hypothetical protein
MLALRRFVFAALTLAFSLPGCGGAQGTVPETSRSDIREQSGGDLLYVLGFNSNSVYMYSYPEKKLVGRLTGLEDTPTGLCADSHGDVFVTEEDNVSNEPPGNYVVEYAHGGTAPIATLTDDYSPWSCSVDPTTGDLAVTNFAVSERNVAIYADAQGSPAYIPSPLEDPFWAAYDDMGDLFVSGAAGSSKYALTELRSGQNKFELVSLDKSVEVTALQWNDGYLVAGYGRRGSKTKDLYQIQISGTKGSVVGTTVLNLGRGLRYGNGQGQFLIVGDKVLATGALGSLERWPYPSGGNGKTMIKHVQAYGMALSVAPSNHRSR